MPLFWTGIRGTRNSLGLCDGRAEVAQAPRTKVAPVTIWLGRHPVGTRNRPQVWLNLTGAQSNSRILPTPVFPASHTHPPCFPCRPDTEEMGDTRSFHSSSLTQGHAHVHRDRCTHMHMRDRGNACVVWGQRTQATLESFTFYWDLS